MTPSVPSSFAAAFTAARRALSRITALGIPATTEIPILAAGEASLSAAKVALLSTSEIARPVE
jgi:hypothetical protein